MPGGLGHRHPNMLRGAQILCAPCEIVCPRGASPSTVTSGLFLISYVSRMDQMAWTGRPSAAEQVRKGKLRLFPLWLQAGDDSRWGAFYEVKECSREHQHCFGRDARRVTSTGLSVSVEPSCHALADFCVILICPGPGAALGSKLRTLRNSRKDRVPEGCLGGTDAATSLKGGDRLKCGSVGLPMCSSQGLRFAPHCFWRGAMRQAAASTPLFWPRQPRPPL